MPATLTIDGAQVIVLPADKAWSISYKPDAVPTPKPPDAITQRLSVKGVVCYGSDDPNKAKPILTDCGITGLRWWGTTRFRGLVDPSFVKQAKAWKAAGVKRIGITFTPTINSPASDLPNTTQVKEWAKSIRDTFPGAIDFVQIVNECNLSKYWPGTIQQAADICHTVSAALLGSSVQVYAPSISEVVAKFGELVKTGIGGVVDAFDIHPYGMNSAEHLARAQAMVAMAPGKKFVASEFGLHSGSYSGWRVEIAKAWEGIKPLLNEVYGYRLLVKTGTETFAGKFGLAIETSDGSYLPNPDCYPTWKAMTV